MAVSMSCVENGTKSTPVTSCVVVVIIAPRSLPNYLAAGECPDREVGRFDRRATRASDRTLMDHREHALARVHQVLDVEIDVAEGGDGLAPHLADAVMADVHRSRVQGRTAHVREIPD